MSVSGLNGGDVRGKKKLLNEFCVSGQFQHFFCGFLFLMGLLNL